MKIAKDTPLAELILRRYEKPSESGRALIRKLCLSLGLLQPGDSRDIIVDVFYVLIKNKVPLTSKEIEEKVIKLREEHRLALLGITPSNIRRQLKRLRDLFLVEKRSNKYQISENSSLIEIFEEKIEKFLLPSILSRVKEHLKRVDELMGNSN